MTYLLFLLTILAFIFPRVFIAFFIMFFPVIVIVLLLSWFSKTLPSTKVGRITIGEVGELTTIRFLRKLNPKEYFIFNDIYLKSDSKIAQIDHIVVSQYGVFIVETKTWKGSVYGSRYSDTWTRYVGGRTYLQPNPVKQNRRHVNIFKNVFSEYPYLEAISIIAFSGYTTREIKDDLSMRISQIPEYILSFTNPVMSIETRDRIIHKLSVLAEKRDSLKEEHSQYVKKSKEYFIGKHRDFYMRKLVGKR